MTQEETLKELRLLEQPLPFWGKRDMEIAKSAADLIESLLSERADKDNHIAALAAELTDKNGQLKFHAEQLLDDVKRIDGLTARAESAEAENKKLRQEIDITDAANTALEGALKQAEAERDAAIEDIEKLLEQPDYLGVCWAGANDCKKGDECKPKWRGARKEGEK